MMAARGGIILSSLSAFQRFGTSVGIFPAVLSQVRHYAARKGTREKAKKKKVKKEVKKLTIQDKIRLSRKVKIVKPDILKYDYIKKPVAIDDVWLGKDFKWKIYPFAEAIQCHREMLHPTMYDMPDTLVNIFVELNFRGIKNKTLDAFHKMVTMKHLFDHGEERNILVFCKKDEQIKAALEGGAALAGGVDIIKLIQNGEVSLNNYDTVLSNPEMMAEVLTLRGLLKKKVPNIKNGTLGLDIADMVYHHVNGIKYSAKPCENFPQYGTTSIPIGKLNMEVEHLEENMQVALNHLMQSKPKRPGPFVLRLRLEAKPSKESFKLDHKLYVKQDEEEATDEKDGEESDEEDQHEEAVAN
ncbi:hypothetical protein TKK_0011422 [Trichogramma kaykai]|uniref:39S ribosomal protein L1, mitochondrial n=1 Tax=Trichogramma kaykai TaxID=54128 RepID=A0ABD2WTD6_9HYME